MVSTGRRERLSDIAFSRLARWASRQDYTCVLIKTHFEEEGRLPHYAKLLVGYRFPGYDRYCVVDDDILINSHAPPLPELPEGAVGLAKDAEQNNTKNPRVAWTGNTGFIVADKAAQQLLLEAYEKGDDPSIWGIADQGALNSVLWAQGKIVEIDQRWNYAPVLTYFLRQNGWKAWRASRRFRLSYYAKVAANPWSRERRALRDCWGCHMIRAPYPTFFDQFVP